MRANSTTWSAISVSSRSGVDTTPLPKLGAVNQSDQVDILTPGQWRSWLKHHHERDGGVWVVLFKKSSGRAKVDYEDLVCEAVCWGWIDSKVGRVDDERSRIWFAPRRPRSAWSDSNIRRVERLTAEGRMQPAGERAVLRAKEAGLWNGRTASGAH